MSWIDDALGGGSMREQLMGNLQTIINMYRADGFYDMEIYNLIYGLYSEAQDYKVRALLPLYDYWMGVLLDWDDEVEVG